MVLSRGSPTANGTDIAKVRRPPRALKKLKFGSHFSGMESWGLALRTLGVNHESVFACDSHAPCRSLIGKLYKPKHLYKDVKESCTRDTPTVDVLCSSPPCQTFSSAGKGDGEKDPVGNFEFIINYLLVKNHLPSTAHATH